MKTILDPASTALLVIDKQAGYFDPDCVAARFRELPDNSSTILRSIDSFVIQSRECGVKVIWTQMVEDIEMSPRPIVDKMRMSPEGITTIARPGDYSFEIYGETRPLQDEKCITKYHYDAFSQPDLGEYLHENGIRTLIFAGGYATRCVLSSVVGANNNDIFCVLAKDLVVNQANASHEMVLLHDVVDAIFGITATSDDIVRSWKSR